jgi:hypothetical protein
VRKFDFKIVLKRQHLLQGTHLSRSMVNQLIFDSKIVPQEAAPATNWNTLRLEFQRITAQQTQVHLRLS